MKRLHVHVGVENLATSIRFYSTMFGAEPTVLKQDYAKWMLEDPRVNFAISMGNHARTGIEHLGIQVDSSTELGEVYGRIKAANRPVLEEGRTTCCYAKSEKRSEEHTYELQSLMRNSYAVFCLNKNKQTHQKKQT